MDERATEADVVVIGAGTSGLGAARALAEQGRSVIVLERRAEDRGGGARWCNAVLPAHFELARIPLPEPPEVRSKGGASLMISPSGRHRVRIAESPLWECDMRMLVDRLRRDAEALGTEVVYGVEGLRFGFEGERPVVASFGAGGERRTVRASLFVDASGLRGTLRPAVPELAEACPSLYPEDVCSAHQAIFRIADEAGARRFLERFEARPGDAVTELGLEGGYSTRVIRVEPSMEEVSVLTGTIPHGGHRAGKQLSREFVERAPWVGEPVFGGGAPIPLRRISHRLTAAGVALVGDAACQVMAGHGSGIGLGLVAGRALADAVRGAVDPGDPDVLFGYQARYLRSHGAVFAGYDAVRRMSVRLGSEGVERLFATGLFSASLAEAGLHQRLGAPSVGEAITQAAALARDGELRRAVAPTLATMAVARPLYAAHPRARQGGAFAAWRASAEALLPTQSGSGAWIEDEGAAWLGA